MEKSKSLAIPNQEGTVSIPDEFLDGLSFIRYRMDINKGIFINDVTGEEKQDLLVRVCGIKMERVLIDESGELVCASRDTKSSKDGAVCEVCPNVNNIPCIDGEEQKLRYDAACKRNNIKNPQPWNPRTRCSLRLVVQWIEEWDKNQDGSYTWICQPGLCYLSCGKSSIANMIYRTTGYLARLKSKGYGDPRYVVTKIKIGSRKNEKLNTSYSYETFEIEDTYANVTKKSVNFEEMNHTIQELGIVSPEVVQPLPKTAGLPSESKGKVRETVLPPQTSKTPQSSPEPEKTPQIPPLQSPQQKEGEETVLSRLQIKLIFNKLPADVQKIILDAIKIDSLDKLTDNQLGMAMKTIKLAEDEVNKKGNKPVTKQNTGKKNPW